jgi:hypothetical protein
MIALWFCGEHGKKVLYFGIQIHIIFVRNGKMTRARKQSSGLFLWPPVGDITVRLMSYYLEGVPHV